MKFIYDLCLRICLTIGLVKFFKINDYLFHDYLLFYISIPRGKDVITEKNKKVGAFINTFLRFKSLFKRN